MNALDFLDGPGVSSSGDDITARVARRAEEMGVPPALALAIVQQESGGKSGLTSPKGAIGPMQLMPGTAKDLGVDPYDDDQNIDGGLRYLKRMLEEFQDPQLAAAAYHAGPGAVRKAGGVPNTNDGLIKTSAYANSVMARAQKLGLSAAPAAGSAARRSALDWLDGGEDAQAGAQPTDLGFDAALNQAAQAVAKSSAGKGSVLSDLAYGAAKGAGQLVQGAGWLVGSDSIEQLGRDAAGYWGEKQSDKLKSQLGAVDQAEGFWNKLGALKDNPAAFADMVVGSLPMMVPGMGLGGLGARGVAAVAERAAINAALKAGATETAAATAGRMAAQKSLEKGAAYWTAVGSNVASEGAVSGGLTGSEVERFALEKGASPADAKSAANEAALKAGAVTAALSGLGARFETDAMLGKLTDKGWAGVAKNVGKEALEEGAQNPAEDYAQYEGKAKFDPAQRFDLGGSVASGLAAGGVMGGGIHMAGRAANKLLGEPPAEVAPKIEDIGNAGSIDQAIAAAGAVVDEPMAKPAMDFDALSKVSALSRLSADQMTPAQAEIASQMRPEGSVWNLAQTMRQSSELTSSADASAPEVSAPVLRERDFVPPPSGTFGAVNELADLVGQERADVDARRAGLGQASLNAQIADVDTRVAAAREKESMEKRMAVLDNVIGSDAAVSMPPEAIANAFSGALQAQGFTNSSPTEQEVARIHRAIAARDAILEAEKPLPSAPNELVDAVPEKKAQAQQPPLARVKSLLGTGYVLQGKQLVGPSGNRINLTKREYVYARGMRRPDAVQAASAVSPAVRVKSLFDSGHQLVGKQMQSPSGERVDLSPQEYVYARGMRKAIPEEALPPARTREPMPPNGAATPALTPEALGGNQPQGMASLALSPQKQEKALQLARTTMADAKQKTAHPSPTPKALSRNRPQSDVSIASEQGPRAQGAQFFQFDQKAAESTSAGENSVEPQTLSDREKLIALRDVRSLNEALERQGAGPVKMVAKAPSSEHQAARNVAKLFGVKLHFVTENSVFDGVAHRGVAYITEKMKRPVLAIAGHEVFHSLEQANPELADKFKEAVEQYLQPDAVPDRRMKESVQGQYWLKPGGQMVSMEYARSEVLADLNGSFWLDHRFWKELAAKDINLFRQVGYKFMELLTRAIDSLTGTRFDVHALVTDADKVRSLIAETWAAHNKQRDSRSGGQSSPREEEGKPDASGEVGTRSAAMQDAPTFSRDALGAGSDPILSQAKNHATAQARKDDGGVQFSQANDHELVSDAYYGESNRAQKRAIRDAVSDLLTTTKTFSSWDKTIGTQYGKAQKDKDFKRVYDSAQSYIEDISRYANQAANQAPNLLPKLSNFTDAFKGVGKDISGQRKKDVAAVSKPVFEGTLHYQVYTDAQLRQRFNLTNDQIAQYREFRAAVDQSLDDLVISEMARAARSAGAEVAGIMEAGSPMAALQAFNASVSDPDLQEAMLNRVARVEELKEQGYAPLMRYGKYTVYASRDGEQLGFYTFEAEREANAFVRELKADPEMEGATITQGVMSEEAYKLFQGISPDTLEVFGEAATIEAVGDGGTVQTVPLKDNPVYQQYLKLAVANRSALKRLIKRKGTAGYEMDAQRVLAGFLTSNARAVSANYHMADMAAAANDIPKAKGDVKDEAVKLVSYLKNPGEEAAKLRGLLFINYLGGSLASAMVNMTQPVMMTFPYLSQWGAGKAALHMSNAAHLVARGSFSGKLGEAMKRAADEGITEPHEIHSLYGESARTFGSNMGVRRLLRVWGGFFSAAEAFNRKVTFAAAWRMAQGFSAEQLADAGAADAYDFAVKSVNETQGVYSKANRPNWARGAAGATVFTFKQYSIHYLEWLKRLPRPQQAIALGMLVLVSGINGLPFSDDLDDLIDAMMQHLGYSWNTKEQKRRRAAAIFGKDAAEFLLSGVSALPGVPLDVQGRLGMGNLLPGTGLLKKTSEDPAKDAMELAGPAGSFAKSMVTSTKAAFSGEFDQALKGVAPAAVQNAMKMVDMLQTGAYRDTKGRKVIDTDMMDAIFKGIGFQPSEVARSSHMAREQQELISLNREVEKEIAADWAAGVFERKPEKVREAMKNLATWNKANPESRIDITASQISRRVKEMRSGRSDRIIRSAPKAMRAQVAQEIEE